VSLRCELAEYYDENEKLRRHAIKSGTVCRETVNWVLAGRVFQRSKGL
jgi:hypothetical protein